MSYPYLLKKEKLGRLLNLRTRFSFVTHTFYFLQLSPASSFQAVKLVLGILGFLPGFNQHVHGFNQLVQKMVFAGVAT